MENVHLRDDRTNKRFSVLAFFFFFHCGFHKPYERANGSKHQFDTSPRVLPVASPPPDAAQERPKRLRQPRHRGRRLCWPEPRVGRQVSQNQRRHRPDDQQAEDLRKFPRPPTPSHKPAARTTLSLTEPIIPSQQGLSSSNYDMGVSLPTSNPGGLLYSQPGLGCAVSSHNLLPVAHTHLQRNSMSPQRPSSTGNAGACQSQSRAGAALVDLWCV